MDDVKGFHDDLDDLEGDEKMFEANETELGKPTTDMTDSPKSAILPVPELSDDLETTARKMTSLAKVIQDGTHLTIWTGWKLASNQPRDPKSIAKSEMSIPELEAYELWNEGKGVTPPTMDWNANVAAVPDGKNSLKRLTQRAAAMDVVWGRRQGTTLPEHAAWLTFNMGSALPLVKAVTRMLNAERYYGNEPRARMTDLEAAELDTLCKIRDTAERNRSRELARIRKLMREIVHAQGVIGTRIRALERKHPGIQD
ncbi:hypothetical protein ASPWEDRAFT_41654 [Aspergillus wentii DTO 134E9]|uniref:Uncharacterized protein n=1 Tax=Aspergillus wentii DTO 134E9 TaxID=1073089 RepID=A0A1L9RFU0_ASPWE|nr:uncharacterized protein ASPWEDRAFT_41654 [Aspergillus wentii DTO 134E9]OJJ33785.1 hypothetical protein ASPWEDRAFT_41654 [Aspergillus wentii DTO 134E9]